MDIFRILIFWFVFLHYVSMVTSKCLDQLHLLSSTKIKVNRFVLNIAVCIHASTQGVFIFMSHIFSNCVRQGVYMQRDFYKYGNLHRLFISMLVSMDPQLHQHQHLRLFNIMSDKLQIVVDLFHVPLCFALKFTFSEQPAVMLPCTANLLF